MAACLYMLFCLIPIFLVVPSSSTRGVHDIFQWIEDGKSCREINEPCSNQFAKAKCCNDEDDTERVQCKISATSGTNGNHHRRFQSGICCIALYRNGCSVDAECCDESAFCDVGGVCKTHSTSKSEGTSDANMPDTNEDKLNDNSVQETESEQRSSFQVEVSPAVIVFIAMVLIVVTACLFMYAYGFNKERQNVMHVPTPI